MWAFVQDTYGSPDVLRLREIETPVIGDDELLVGVRAAGVDQGVWQLMVAPVVGRTFPVSEVPEAIRSLRDGRAHGTVVITV